MRMLRDCLAWGCLLATGFCATAHAGELSALAGQADLTPEKLIRSFAEFTFELSAQPQDAETFLQRKRGDCDDFAILASRLLTERGFKTKLIAVMMAEQTHVVCYVEEAHGFLDFNHRAQAHPVIASDGSLEDVAQKVARDFRAPWQMASEFRREKNSPVYLNSVFASTTASKVEAAAITPAAPFKSRESNNAVAIALTLPVPFRSGKIAQAGSSTLPWRNSR